MGAYCLLKLPGHGRVVVEQAGQRRAGAPIQRRVASVVLRLVGAHKGCDSHICLLGWGFLGRRATKGQNLTPSGG
jgi:hypothetical protein